MLTHRKILWQTCITVEDIDYDALWSLSHDAESGLTLHDVFLHIVLAGTEGSPDETGMVPRELWGVSLTDDDLESRVQAAVANERIQELQVEYAGATTDEGLLERAKQILTRVWGNEYMGQQRNSYYFYLETLADILALGMDDEAFLFDGLHKAQFAGLNGAILVPFEEEKAAYEFLEKQTGHKKLEVSDSGNWYCDYCYNSGYNDSETATSPSDVPCIPTVVARQKD